MKALNLNQTMIQVLENTAHAENTANGYTFLHRNASEFVSYEQLWIKATCYAGYFQQQGMKPGDYVSLIMPTCPEFTYCFYGIMMCGAIPTVLASPMFGDQKEGFNRLNKIGELLEVNHIVLNQKEYELIGDYLKDYECLVIERILDEQMPIKEVHRPSPEDTAIVQATSGSTGLPKAVPLSHRNVIANMQQIGDRVNITSESVVVSWLPLYHDFGLFGNFLLCSYWNINGVLQTPFGFMRRPHTWLKAIGDYKATHTSLPNFALSYAVDRISEKVRGSLDLSSLKTVVIGAEPINMNTLRKFGDYFKPAGFDSTAFTPGYGGAEGCLLLTMKPHGDGPGSSIVSRSALSEKGVAEEPSCEADRIEFADCGVSAIFADVEVRGTDGNGLSDGCVGHIWWKSPSLTNGYIGREELNKKEFVDGWFNSGDQGYIKNGHLFITGRYKEIVIVRGQNYFPVDFETAASEVEGTKEGRIVAFGDVDDETGSEELVLVCGIDKLKDEEKEKLEKSIKTHVADKTGVMPYKIQFLSDKAIPRTTSGKLQRGKVKQLYSDSKKQ